MNLKLTVGPVDLCSFIIDLIQQISAMYLLYKVLGRC